MQVEQKIEKENNQNNKNNNENGDENIGGDKDTAKNDATENDGDIDK